VDRKFVPGVLSKINIVETDLQGKAAPETAEITTGSAGVGPGDNNLPVPMPFL
jgi:hypothetical protein